LSTLATLVFRMKDLGHQAQSLGPHMLSFTTAATGRRTAVSECSTDASVAFTTTN
jgi:hypothetical protein